MQPELVAAKVVDAIVNERFWILTHEETKKMVEDRMTGIVGDRNPVFEPGE